MILTTAVFLVLTKSSGTVPSLSRTLRVHDETVRETLLGTEESVIRREWGPPDSENEYASSAVLRYHSVFGKVTLYFTDGVCTETVILPVSLLDGLAEYPLLMFVTALAAVIVPAVLVMLVLSLFMKREGWLPGDAGPGSRSWLFTNWKGSRPWTGV